MCTRWNFNQIRYKLCIACVCLTLLLLNSASPLPADVQAAGAMQAAYTDTISQWGITWTFDKPYQYGRFANGDYWVLVDPGTNSVVINSITPNVRQVTISGTPYYINGWEVNPVYDEPQGFDERAGNFDHALTPALPYAASGGQSVIKSISRDLGNSSARPTLETAAVLTVLDAVPPDGTGAGYFRPPYVGTDKPYYPISSIQTELLPKYKPVDNTPSLDDMIANMQRVQMDHKGGRTGSYIRPMLNIGGQYAPFMAIRSTDAILRLMVYDPAESAAKKQELLIYCLQKGIDMYHFVLLGQTWPAGGGHQPGHLLPLTFASVMLDHADMQTEVANATFWHEIKFNHRGANGEALYGERNQYLIEEEGYWQTLATQSRSTSERDPYGIIDGGWNPGGEYQFCCVSKPWKGEALAFQLFSALKDVWNRTELFDYADRWVTSGTYTQPDPCAPAPLLTSAQWENKEAHGYGTTWGPDPADPGDCIPDANPGDGVGRFPDHHNTSVDGGGYGSPFQDAMWETYRNSPGSLTLRGAPADRAIHLKWWVSETPPATTTWRIDYYTPTMTIPFTATDPLSTTRSTVLTDHVQNYQWYTVTLHAMDGTTSILSDTVRVMPTDIFLHLPLVLKED